MAMDFLNDAQKEIEGQIEDFYRELKAFYQGNGEAEQKLMEQTTQPFWQSLRLSQKDCVPEDTGDRSGKLFESGRAGRSGCLS